MLVFYTDSPPCGRRGEYKKYDNKLFLLLILPNPSFYSAPAPKQVPAYRR